jgi:hypothetical protein
MYHSPELKKLGTLREITLSGRYGASDAAAIRNDGCVFGDPNGRCS